MTSDCLSEGMLIASLIRCSGHLELLQAKVPDCLSDGMLIASLMHADCLPHQVPQISRSRSHVRELVVGQLADHVGLAHLPAQLDPDAPAGDEQPAAGDGRVPRARVDMLLWRSSDKLNGSTVPALVECVYGDAVRL